MNTMKKICKNIGILFTLFLAVSCADDSLKENGSFIPGNPNPDGENLPPNEQWDWVGRFPGEVSTTAQRLQGSIVTVKGDYTLNKQTGFTKTPMNWQGSGLYVPPAEKVEVIVPAGVSGLHYQLGIADVFIPSQGNKYARYEQVTKTGKLEAGTSNFISSNFGGHLYFYFEDQPTTNELTLTVNGAVKFTDYLSGQSNLPEWRKEITDTINNYSIWGELIGEKIIMTLPVSALRNLERPDALLDFYDDFIRTNIEPLYGMTAANGINAPLGFPWRMYLDVQLPKDPFITGTQEFGSNYQGGYPMALNQSSLKNIMTDLIKLKDLASDQDISIARAFGASYEMEWGKGKDIRNQVMALPLYRFAHRKNMWPGKPNVDFASAPGKFKEDPTFRFDNLDDNLRMTMLLQLAQQYGWNIYSHISQRVREEVKDSVKIDILHNDFLAMYASEYANANLIPFFEAWKFPISAYAKGYMEQFPAVATDFWSSFNKTVADVNGSRQPQRFSPKPIPTHDTVYDRSAWKGDCSPLQSGTKEGEIAKILDNNATTIWHSKWENGKPSPDGGQFPHWISLNFDDEAEKELEFNYFYLQPRQGGASHNTPRIFKVEILDEESGRWVGVDENKEFYLRKENNMQWFYLKQTYKAKKVRLYMLTPQTANTVPAGQESHRGKPWDENRAQTESVSVAEFGLGLIY